MSQPFLGQITVYPYTFPPLGWADCVGQILPISQYTALFSLLGTNFGGNGTSNFGLPNMQGRVPVNQGQLLGGSVYDLGEAGGFENVTLTSQQSGAHNHVMNATTVEATVNTPTGNLLATPQAGSPRNPTKGDIYNTAAPNTILVATSISTTPAPVPHNNLQPFLVLRYCIAMSGVYPSRG